MTDDNPWAPPPEDDPVPPGQPGQPGPPAQPGPAPQLPTDPAPPQPQPPTIPQMPPSGYPPQPYPPQGYPAQGYPAQGYPAPGYPAQGYPGQGHPAQPSYGQPQYAGQGYPGYAYPPVRTTSGRATAVMILGIASLVTMCASGLGFIPAIVALCLAPGAKRDIRASNGAIDGETQVKTGVICSWITIGLSILAMVALVIFIIALARDPHPYYRNSY